MDNNGNPTKLISANGVNELKLGMANGYNNAVYLINEMCKTLYSGNQGTATGLTIEDLENNYFSDTAISARDSYAGAVTYGKTKYYLSKWTVYPNIAKEEARMGIETTLVEGKNAIRTGGLGLSEQTQTYTGSGDENASTVATTNKGITVTQTAYSISSSSMKYKNATLYNIFHKSPKAKGSNTVKISNYWLASRCVNTESSICSFNVFFVSDTYVTSRHMSRSGTGGGSESKTIRPVINLNSGIQAEYSEKYNDTYNIWNLQ